jgi:hypothetical protein
MTHKERNAVFVLKDSKVYESTSWLFRQIYGTSVTEIEFQHVSGYMRVFFDGLPCHSSFKFPVLFGRYNGEYVEMPEGFYKVHFQDANTIVLDLWKGTCICAYSKFKPTGIPLPDSYFNHRIWR